MPTRLLVDPYAILDTLARRHVSAEDARTTSCAICMEDTHEHDSFAKLECAHEFHAHCLILWFRQKLSCPMCRHEVPVPA